MFVEYGKLSTKLYEITKPVGKSIDGDIEYYYEKLKSIEGPILEAGVGTGRMLIPFIQKGLNVEGVDLSEEMLDKMVSGKEEYIYQLERIKRQDRIQKIFDTSKLIVCIVGGVIAVIMCVQLYLKLCNTYMSAPFKVITLILSLILVVSILRIIVCNETK